jgi:hypothetical protein
MSDQRDFDALFSIQRREPSDSHIGTAVFSFLIAASVCMGGWMFHEAIVGLVAFVIMLVSGSYFITLLYGRPTLWQIRHPRKAWWMAHTGKSVLAEEVKYEAELHRVISEALCEAAMHIK